MPTDVEEAQAAGEAAGRISQQMEEAAKAQGIVTADDPLPKGTPKILGDKTTPADGTTQIGDTPVPDPKGKSSTDELAAQDPLVRTDQTVSPNDPLHTVQGTEDIKDARARGTSFGSAVRRSFLSGDNYAVQIYSDIARKVENGGVDPNFNQTAFIEANKDNIPSDQQWRYMLSANGGEAHDMLMESKQSKIDQEVLAKRGGFSTFVARGVAGLVDIDTPIAIMSGGLSAEAKLGLNATKIGRMAAGAVGGAVSQTGAATLGTLADPAGDWNSIPIAGLAGAAFGTFGGALAHAPERMHAGERVSEAANAARDKVLNEFGETQAEGAPLAARDIREASGPHLDPYHSEAAQRAAAADAERARAVKPAEGVEPPATDAVGPRGEAPTTGPKAFRIEDAAPQGELPEGYVIEHGSSVGAAQQPTTGPGINSVESPRIKDIIQTARDRDQTLGVTDEWYTNAQALSGKGFGGDAVAKAAQRFHDVVTASPLVTDFGRMMRSGSKTAAMLAYDMLESASGIVRNNNNAAALMEHYHKELQAAFIPYQDAYKEWTVRVKQASHWDRITTPTMRHEFDEALVTELQARRYDGPGSSRHVDPAVAKAADAMDHWSAKEIELNKGRPGEGTTKGFETLKPTSGYMPQKWSGRKMQKVITSLGHQGKEKVTQAVAEGYRVMHPAMSPADAKVFAKAVVDRTLRGNESLSTNLIGVLQSDGRGAVEDLLRRNGVPAAEAGKLIDRLTGNMVERGRAGHTKERIDIDMRYKAQNGLRIMDLMDTDINSLVSQRSRRSAGSAALARKGILSKADFDEIAEAIIQEQRANGASASSGKAIGDFIDKDKHLTKEDLDAMYSYFGGGPIGGGTSPWVSRMKKITNLALLNQLGLAQFAEFGPMIATVGWKRFTEFASKEVMDNLRKTDSELVKELKHMNVLVPEERLFRDDMTFEYEKGAPDTNVLLRKFDDMLNKGQRLQGYTSGFYAIRNIQQRIAVTSAADKIMRDLRDGKLSQERARDVGMSHNSQQHIESLIRNGAIEFKGDGLHKLNLDQWNPKLAEDFILNLNRVVNQNVQKGLAGESSYLFHKDGLAALFLHLKAFPMLALEKQALRTLRIADQESMATFMYGMLTAGAAYTVKQAVNYKTDNLTAGKIMKGAFGMSNMTGWIPMWTDPLGGMLGLPDWTNLGGGNSRGGPEIVSMPAAMTTINKMLGVPGAIEHTLTGNQTNNDVRALQALPIVGNAYGFTAAFNAMKEHNKAANKQAAIEKRAAKKAEAEKEPVKAPAKIEDPAAVANKALHL